MRKLLVPFIFSLLSISSNLFAQIKVGDSFVDVYYGFPDWYKYIFRNEYGYYNNSSMKIGSIGYMGARAEYMVAKRIGFGLDIWYAQANISVTRSETYYDNYYYYSSDYSHNNTPRTRQVEIKESLARLTCLGRFIFHIGRSQKIDPYFHAGFGVVNYTHSYSNTSPSIDGGHNRNFFLVGARVGFGMRVFFTENLGAIFDLGLGGALFTTGLTYKFPSKAE